MSTQRHEPEGPSVCSAEKGKIDDNEAVPTMKDQPQDSGQQLTHTQSHEEPRLDAEVNVRPGINTPVDSLNLSPSRLATECTRTSANQPRSHFRDYVDHKYFDSLVSIVQNASDDVLPVRVPVENMEAKQLLAVFERVRRHAVHQTLTKVDEAILFAVADMFISESKVSSWYGQKLVSKMLLVGSHRIRYLILRLVWNGFRADMKLNMSVESTTQFLKGLLVVVQEASQFVRPLHETTEKYYVSLDQKDHEESQAMKQKLDSKQAEWFQLQRNLLLVFKIIRLFVRNARILGFINKSDEFLTVTDSLLSNPMAPEDTFCECLSFAAKSHGFLGALDKKEPLGTVPQVVMHVAEYCMDRSGPSWSVPRFLTEENASIETINRTSAIAFAAVKSFAASIERESLFFEPLCDSIMRMYGTEVLNDKGTIIGQAFGTLLSRFPSSVALKDEFITQIISGIHSCKDKIADLVDTLLYVITEQYPNFVGRHEGAIREARSTRKLLQDSLDGKLNYFPKMPQDWYP